MSDFTLTTKNQSCPGMRVGGIVMYPAMAGIDVEVEVERIAQCIDRKLESFLTVAKVVLFAAVREMLGFKNAEKRIMSAILNRTLHQGFGHAMLCESINGAVFQVLISAKRFDEVIGHLESVRSIARKRGVIQVREVEKLVFGTRVYNSWSSSSHLLARLVRIGWVSYESKDGFRFSHELEDA